MSVAQNIVIWRYREPQQGLEKEYTQTLQHESRLAVIWRVVGEYTNYSIFDVDTNDELQQILSGLPLYQYMKMKVTPPAKHPSPVG